MTLLFHDIFLVSRARGVARRVEAARSLQSDRDFVAVELYFHSRRLIDEDRRARTPTRALDVAEGGDDAEITGVAAQCGDCLRFAAGQQRQLVAIDEVRPELLAVAFIEREEIGA